MAKKSKSTDVLSIYRDAVYKAYDDGIVTEDEKEVLKNLGKSLKLTKAEMKNIVKEAKEKFKEVREKAKKGKKKPVLALPPSNEDEMELRTLRIEREALSQEVEILLVDDKELDGRVKEMEQRLAKMKKEKKAMEMKAKALEEINKELNERLTTEEAMYEKDIEDAPIEDHGVDVPPDEDEGGPVEDVEDMKDEAPPTPDESEDLTDGEEEETPADREEAKASLGLDLQNRKAIRDETEKSRTSQLERVPQDVEDRELPGGEEDGGSQQEESGEDVPEEPEEVPPEEPDVPPPENHEEAPPPPAEAPPPPQKPAKEPMALPESAVLDTQIDELFGEIEKKDITPTSGKSKALPEQSTTESTVGSLHDDVEDMSTQKSVECPNCGADILVELIPGRPTIFTCQECGQKSYTEN